MARSYGLNELRRIILQRGIQIDPDGINHKHNEAVLDSPRSPIKLHLCTPELRKEGRLTEEDMQKIVQMFWSYIEHGRFKVPALGGIPRVGEKFALMLQAYIREQTGLYLPVVRTEKIDRPDGTREIGPVIPCDEYPSGDLWLIDDVVNWGYSKREAFARYKEAGYRVTESLVAVDYGVGAARMISKEFHARLHALMSLDSILDYGKRQNLLAPDIVVQTRGYLVASRETNLAKTSAAAL